MAGDSHGVQLLSAPLKLREPVFTIRIEYHPARRVVRRQGVEARGETTQQVRPDHVRGEGSLLAAVGAVGTLESVEGPFDDRKVLVGL